MTILASDKSAARTNKKGYTIVARLTVIDGITRGALELLDIHFPCSLGLDSPEIILFKSLDWIRR